MGLGKTLTMISHIVSRRRREEEGASAAEKGEKGAGAAKDDWMSTKRKLFDVVHKRLYYNKKYIIWTFHTNI